MNKITHNLRPTALLPLLLGAVLTLSACAAPQGPKGVYLLLDTSGTYTVELEKAKKIVNLLLGTLEAGDSLAVARIDSASFSEKDIVARMVFDQRPSTANNQKRAFKKTMDGFAQRTQKGSAHTDITGGILQAVEWLTETGAGQQTVLLFTDLEEDLIPGHIRDFPLDLAGVRVVAINVTKLRSDNIDPRKYMARLDAWKTRVEQGGGRFEVINDLDHFSRVFAG